MRQLHEVSREEGIRRFMAREVVYAAMRVVDAGAIDLQTVRDSEEMAFFVEDDSQGQDKQCEELDEETLRKLYVRGRWSAKKIADKYSLDVSKVFGLLSKYGITRPAGADDPVERAVE